MNADTIPSLAHEQRGGSRTSPAPEETHFIRACKDGQLKLALSLLSKGIAIDALDEDGRTGLMLAAANRDDSLVTALLEHGAKINLVDDAGWSALHYAVAAAADGVATRLLATGANPSLEDADSGKTVLHLAARSDMKLLVETLLDAGMQVNHQGTHGWTPLMYAASEGNEETCALLISRGADARLRNRAGETAALLCNAKDIRASLEAAALAASADPTSSPTSSL